MPPEPALLMRLPEPITWQPRGAGHNERRSGGFGCATRRIEPRESCPAETICMQAKLLQHDVV